MYSLPALLSHFIIAVWLVSPLCGQGDGDDRDSGRTIAPDLYSGLRYRMVGPWRGGRSTAVTGFPHAPYTFLMGTTGGGVWKTDDAGQRWRNISDGHFAVGSIGAIEASLSDPNVIYVGTGSASPRGNVSPGNGMYRSTDGGKTWKHIGLEESGHVGRIRVHPENPNLVYVAALGHMFGPNPERGVYRSRDGGETWEQVKSISRRTGAVELLMDPTNPRILYAGFWTVERKPWTIISGSDEGGVFKSSDGGDSWKRLEGGLPEGVVGRVGLALSPINPQRLWVLIESEKKGGVYRSDDGGKSFQQVNRERKLLQRAWYYMRIYADPIDPDTVYALNTHFYKSIDAGKTFTSIPVGHRDCHDLWLNPANPQILIQANDGGAHVSLNGGRSWSTLQNQPTAEMYRVTVDNQFPYRIYGAQQDNTTISVPSRIIGNNLAPRGKYVGGCESGHIAVDPRDPDIIYAGCYGGAISRTNLRTGRSRDILVYPQLQLGQAPRDLKYRFQWNAPIRLSPHDPDVVYHASHILHASRDAGHSWRDISPDLTRNDRSKQDFAGEPITRDNSGVEVYGTIFAFEESAQQRGLLWVGSDDGLVHVSQDGGQNWDNVTPAGLPEWATIHMIDPSHHDPGLSG